MDHGTRAAMGHGHVTKAIKIFQQMLFKATDFLNIPALSKEQSDKLDDCQFSLSLRSGIGRSSKVGGGGGGESGAEPQTQNQNPVL